MDVQSGRGRAQCQCQLCSQSTEDKLMKNYHEPVGTGTVRKETVRLHDQPLNCPIRHVLSHFTFANVIRSGQSLIRAIKSSTTSSCKIDNRFFSPSFWVDSPHRLSLFLTHVLPHSQTHSPFCMRFSFHGERVFDRKAASSTIGAHVRLFLWHVEHITHWNDWISEGFTMSVRLRHSFKRRQFSCVNSSTRKNRLQKLPSLKS